MSPPDGPVPAGGQYAKRREELAAATETGTVLAHAGDLLRREAALGNNSREVSTALAKLKDEDVAAFVESIGVQAQRKKLESTLNEAFEALLADNASEKGLFSGSAMEGLLERDRLESARIAIAHKNQKPNQDMENKLATIDDGLAARARMLVGINHERRTELELIDERARARAWWFSSRSECDALADVLSGKDSSRAPAHIESCEACRRDAGRAAASAPPKHVNAQALWRMESREASEAEMRWIRAHASSCPSCRKAIDAVETE